MLALIADHPDDQVAAYQQLAQSYADTGERQAAAAMLRTGIAKAKAAGDWHAAAEMEQMLASLGDSRFPSTATIAGGGEHCEMRSKCLSPRLQFS